MHGCVRHVGTDEDGGMEALVLALCLVYMLSVSEVPLVNTLVYTTCGAVCRGCSRLLVLILWGVHAYHPPSTTTHPNWFQAA
jgi:hypothetical protein